jgi:hypothetical protein
MKKLIHHFLFILFLPLVSIAQKNENDISTDLPSESLSHSVVPHHSFQSEAGFSREQTVEEGVKHVEYLYPRASIRYGLSKQPEFRVLIEEEGDYDYDPDKHKTSSGLEPVQAGFKFELTKGKGIVPHTALIAMASIPKAASPDFKGDFVAPYFRVSMENELSKKISIAYNLGHEWENDDVHGRFLISFCPEYSISEKVSIFAEAYGKISNESAPENVIDAGLFYNLRKSMQVSLNGGVGTSEEAPNNFVQLGFSIRLP